MNRFTATSALPLCLLLSACGGDGTSTVENIPLPPVRPTPTPTPTPTPQFDVKTSWLDSPATRNGTYDVIGRLSHSSGNGGATTSRTTAPSEFTMSTSWYFGRESGDLPWYSVSAPTGILPTGLTSISVNGPFLSWSFNPPQSYAGEPRGSSYCCQMLGQHLDAYSKAADGSETQILSNDFTRGVSTWQPSASTWLPSDNHTGVQVSLDYDIGYSYVAMGDWGWKEIATGNSGELLFVDGDRTPASGIPVSGTATYDAHSLSLLSSTGTPGIPFTLTADFGVRTIATRIDQDYLYTSQVNAPTQGIHVAGTAPFSNNGLFDIPLAGTANYSSTNSPTTPPSQPVTGDMNGAFFGPQAEQIGGAFSLQNSGGPVLIQDAFVGQQHH